MEQQTVERKIIDNILIERVYPGLCSVVVCQCGHDRFTIAGIWNLPTDNPLDGVRIMICVHCDRKDTK